MKRTVDIYKQFASKKGQIAILIDPDKCSDLTQLNELLKKCQFASVDYIFIGGSTVSREAFQEVIQFIKLNSTIPVVIFPGDAHQVSEKGDALLYLSLISGRNPEYLIGQHVNSANEIFNMDIEIIPTAYILIDGGTKSSVAYVSQTTPIPINNQNIILNTAKAGILQGKKLIYIDAGSGANEHLPATIATELSKLEVPLIIGGGIKSVDSIKKLMNANVLVIGNKIEENIDFLLDIKHYIDVKNN
ncbi:MAG: geranylgeranylglyceryl/heptaprenylglyceryl phosphate synthase [Flavobacteriales bacterium]